MRLSSFCSLCLALAIPALAQQATVEAPKTIKEPRAVFDEAAPFYNFSDPSIKPWHLKVTYQLYGAEGNPAEQGTYEYWWVSPDLHRSTWSRPSATHTDWFLSDGDHASLASGESLGFFEHKLQSALLSPLPRPEELNAAGARLQMEGKKIFTNGDKSPCVMIVPYMPPQAGQLQVVPLGLFPTYCFDPDRPMIRAETSFGTLAMQFNNIVEVQGRFLARKIDFFEGKRELLSATVDSATALSPSDPALTPPQEAKVIKRTHVINGTKVITLNRVNISAGVAVGMLIDKVQPVYPEDAKEAHISGTVVLQALIAHDGSVQDLHVVQAPWPSLAASALMAVSQWKYRPYLLNGNPVEVNTTINVIYTLGR